MPTLLASPALVLVAPPASTWPEKCGHFCCGARESVVVTTYIYMIRAPPPIHTHTHMHAHRHTHSDINSNTQRTCPNYALLPVSCQAPSAESLHDVVVEHCKLSQRVRTMRHFSFGVDKQHKIGTMHFPRLASCGSSKCAVPVPVGWICICASR